MTPETYIKSACAQCGGHIEFPAGAAGLTTDCPHCGQPTELLAPLTDRKKFLFTKKIIVIGIVILILAAGIGGAIFAVKRAHRIAGEKQRAEIAARSAAEKARQEAEALANDPIEQAGFHALRVAIEKSRGSSLIYASGTIQNKTGQRRFGVKVELDLLDASGQKIGSATDYAATIEPHADWKFKALVIEPKAVSAKIIAVNER